ncbi:MAG: CD225/dispanin family protein [Ignavibacteriae bacterium]|nr:CD225/dispanin family protein [Ignavibacteriota bacterium]
MDSFEQNVPNYLVQSILVTIFCCMPTGIAAIIFSSQVNTKLAVGDFDGARESSRKAKLWCWISFGAGVGYMLILGIVIAIYGFAFFSALSGQAQ